MGIQRLRVGMASLGRVGKFHAINFLERTPRAELVAAFTPDANELAWGRLTLEPQGVTLYENYDEMLKHPGLQAVAIGTATSVHAEEAIKAIEQDLHVLCEKPLSIDIEVVNANLGKVCQTAKSISAHGVTAVQPELQKHKDYDNAVGIVEFWNGKIAYYYCTHMMARGQEDTTEIIGTEGKLAVNNKPQSNLVSFYHTGGITREVPPNFMGRFGAAFVTEANEFTEACLDNTPLPMKLTNAVKAVEIGAALQEALRCGKQIRFDEIGRRIEKAQL